MIVPRMASIWRLIRYARCWSSRAWASRWRLEQLLVERAGHLGHEDRVVVVVVRLVLGRVVAVHRVARLVGQREDVVEHVGLVVHQDVRDRRRRSRQLKAPLCLPRFS